MAKSSRALQAVRQILATEDHVKTVVIVRVQMIVARVTAIVHVQMIVARVTAIVHVQTIVQTVTTVTTATIVARATMTAMFHQMQSA
jgi:hypothetical protein